MRNGSLWVAGLRLRTIPASLSPVILGGCAAWMALGRTGPRPAPCPTRVTGACTAPWYAVSGALTRGICAFALCLGVALFLQIAVNFANDYSDGIRGSDRARGDDERQSGKPQRLTASGLVLPRSVLLAAGAAALAASVCGLGVALITRQYWLLAVGVLCLLAGWFYTGGKHPYGYAGLGELFVFVFFGLVATLGTEFAVWRAVDGFAPTASPTANPVYPADSARSGSGAADAARALINGRYGVDRVGVMAAIVVGLYSVIILMVNNLRDVEDDTRSSKRTLAVRIGADSARTLLIASIMVALVVAAALLLAVWRPWGLVAWLPLIPASWATVRAVRGGDYPGSLGGAGRQLLVCTALVVVCTILGGI